MFFLDAPGGCGKTFLIETIFSTIRSEGKISIATAGSDLAATLLTRGRTVHSTFKVPLDITRIEQPFCSIKKGTELSRLIQDCHAIVVDEATMLNKAVFEALDRTLKDIRSTNEIMGGISVMLCGDFRQILPVIRYGTRANIINACIKKSYLWKEVRHLKLTTNMRFHLNGDREVGALAEMLINIVQQPDMVRAAELGNYATSVDDLIDKVFLNFQETVVDSDWLSERGISAPLNESVTKINSKLIDMMPASSKLYKSIDTAMSDDEATHYPPEFLHSIETSGLPPHKLNVKVNMPVMVIRSLNPPRS